MRGRKGGGGLGWGPRGPPPSNRTSPAVGSIKRRMQRPVVDLPQPDSPTSPKVSPRRILKLTSSTALTVSLPAPNNPPPAGKYFFRLLTSIKLPLLFCMLSINHVGA